MDCLWNIHPGYICVCFVMNKSSSAGTVTVETFIVDGFVLKKPVLNPFTLLLLAINPPSTESAIMQQDKLVIDYALKKK